MDKFVELRKALTAESVELLTKLRMVDSMLQRMYELDRKAGSELQQSVEKEAQRALVLTPSPAPKPKKKMVPSEMTLTEAYGRTMEDGNWHTSHYILENMRKLCKRSIDSGRLCCARKHFENHNTHVIEEKFVDQVKHWRAVPRSNNNG